MPSSISIEDFRRALARMPKRPLQKILADEAQKDKRLKGADKVSNVVTTPIRVTEGQQQNTIAASPLQITELRKNNIGGSDTPQADTKLIQTYTLNSEAIMSKSLERIRKKPSFRTLNDSEPYQLQLRKEGGGGGPDICDLNHDHEERLRAYGTGEVGAYKAAVRTYPGGRSVAKISDEVSTESPADAVLKPLPKSARTRKLKSKKSTRTILPQKSHPKTRNSVLRRKRRTPVNELVLVQGTSDDLQELEESDSAHDLVDDPICGSQDSQTSAHVSPQSTELISGQISTLGGRKAVGNARRNAVVQISANKPSLDLSQFRMSVLNATPVQRIRRSGSGFEGYAHSRDRKENMPKTPMRKRKEKIAPYIGKLALVASGKSEIAGGDTSTLQTGKNALPLPKPSGNILPPASLIHSRDGKSMGRPLVRIAQTSIQEIERANSTASSSSPIRILRRRKLARGATVQLPPAIESISREAKTSGYTARPLERERPLPALSASLKRRVTFDEDVYEQFARVTAPARARSPSVSDEDMDGSGEEESLGSIADEGHENDGPDVEDNHESVTESDDSIMLIGMDEDEGNMLMSEDDEDISPLAYPRKKHTAVDDKNSPAGSQILGGSLMRQTQPKDEPIEDSPDPIEFGQDPWNSSTGTVRYMRDSRILENFVSPDLTPSPLPELSFGRKRKRTGSLRLSSQRRHESSTELSQTQVVPTKQHELNEIATAGRNYRSSTIPETPEKSLQSPATWDGKPLKPILRKPSFRMRLMTDLEVDEIQAKSTIDIEETQKPIPASILTNSSYFQESIEKFQQPEMSPIYRTTRRNFPIPPSEIEDSRHQEDGDSGSIEQDPVTSPVLSSLFRTMASRKLRYSTVMSLRELTRSTSMTLPTPIRRSRSMLAPFVPPFKKTTVTS